MVLMEMGLLLSPLAKLTVVLVGEKSPDSAVPPDMDTRMLNERSAAGDTLTVKEAELPSSTVRDAGENDTFSRLGMLPSPVVDQSLSPSLFFDRTCTS